MSGIPNQDYLDSESCYSESCDSESCYSDSCVDDSPCGLSACRYYGGDRNLKFTDPAYQYKTLKIIQNTVRVPSSLYSMNLAALNVYQKPNPQYNVNWNQMSDRKERHFQPNIVTGGSFYHGSSTKNTITRCRPGAGCPGGSGVDIKHNSYDRYLNRIKGKGPVRRGPIPPGFGSPLENLDPAIQGGKTMKTSIVSGCNCPITPSVNPLSEKPLYLIILAPEFSIGQKIYALSSEKHTSYEDINYYAEAVVIAFKSGIYTVQFLDGRIENRTIDQLINCETCSRESNCSFDCSGNCNFDCNGNCNMNCNTICNPSKYIYNFVEEDGVLIPCNLLNDFGKGGNYINIINQYTGKKIIG